MSTCNQLLLVAIPDGQNFHQKVEALAIIKSKYLYTRRKLSVCSVERSQLVVANSIDVEVTRVFNFPIQISIERKWKSASTRADYFGTIRNFVQRAAIGTLFDVRWSLIAQAVPENELFLLKMSIFRNCYKYFLPLSTLDAFHVTKKYQAYYN